MDSPQELPDGSGFFTGSLPLPEDHWLYREGDNVPPMTLQCGTDNPHRKDLEEAIRAGVRYALRCATMNGCDNDFDPDAVVQQTVVGTLGYFTPDGTLNTSNCVKKDEQNDVD